MIKKINKLTFIIVIFIVLSFFSNNVLSIHENSNSTIIKNNLKNYIDTDTEYWALLVAVGEYADDPQQNRPLMLEEVDDLYDVLIESSVWSSDHIKVIKAEDATVPNIILGLRWLDKMEDENDFSLVYISTHGYYLPFDIPPLDEEDNADEFLITYWGFANDFSFIYDDELNVLLNQLESQGVCFIVDSCYAGGFNDPPNWITNNINNLNYVQNKISSEKWIQDFGLEASGQKRVVLMASREDELSYSGGFTPYLIDGLRGYADSNNDDIVSAEELYFYSSPRAYRQTPTIFDGYEGELPLVYLNNQNNNNQNIKKNQDINNPIKTTILTQKNSIIKGYILDNNTNNPIQNAQIQLQSRNQGESYENETTTDSNGYYIFNVPPSRYRITVDKEEYFSQSIWNLQISENETLWTNFTLTPRPPENSKISGYITDINTNKPIIGANITLNWMGEQNKYYRNETISDQSGFYTLNVAVGNIELEIEAQNYFQQYYQDINIINNQNLIYNITLKPHPTENSFICGYITDEETGEPINNTRITFEWNNFQTHDSYQKQIYTNSSGFFVVNIAPGEIYYDIRETEYDYYNPYRIDTQENKTLWLNITLEKQKIQIRIGKPLRAIYINNNRIIPIDKAIIIGKIDIEAYVYEYYYYGPVNQAETVEFYIDNNLKETFTSLPYIWTWSNIDFGKHIIKVVAYDYNGQSTSQELTVYKIL